VDERVKRSQNRASSSVRSGHEAPGEDDNTRMVEGLQEDGVATLEQDNPEREKGGILLGIRIKQGDFHFTIIQYTLKN
jgi:hypothetical protein